MSPDSASVEKTIRARKRETRNGSRKRKKIFGLTVDQAATITIAKTAISTITAVKWSTIGTVAKTAIAVGTWVGAITAIENLSGSNGNKSQDEDSSNDGFHFEVLFVGLLYEEDSMITEANSSSLYTKNSAPPTPPRTRKKELYLVVSFSFYFLLPLL